MARNAEHETRSTKDERRNNDKTSDTERLDRKAMTITRVYVGTRPNSPLLEAETAVTARNDLKRAHCVHSMPDTRTVTLFTDTFPSVKI